MSGNSDQTISGLIADLEALRREHGDLPVLARDCCGNLYSADAGIDRVTPTGWRDRYRLALPDETDTIAVTIR